MAKTTIELPSALHTKLRIKAAVEHRSMNDIVVTALQNSLHDFRLEPDLLEVETVAVGDPEAETKEESHVRRTNRPHQR